MDKRIGGEYIRFNLTHIINLLYKGATMKLLQTVILLFCLGILTPSHPAHAGGGVSGGGNVLACVDASGKESFQLLDYYEATRAGGFGFDLDLGPGKAYPDMIKYVLKRMAQYDGYRSRVYQSLADSFIKDSFFSEEDSATDSEDLGGGFVKPKGCEVKRVVILRSDAQMIVSGSKIKYELVRHLWDRLDEATKAGLIIHEISYREVLKKGARNSLAIRRFVGFVSSKNIASMDYSFEILRAGLETWGEQSPAGFEAHTIFLTGASDARPVFYAPDFRFNAVKIKESVYPYLGTQTVVLRRTGFSQNFFVNILGSRVKCKELELRKDLTNSESLVDFFDLYERLLFQTVSWDDFSQNMTIIMNCEPFQIKSQPGAFRQFDLTISSTKPDSYTDGSNHFLILSGFWDHTSYSIFKVINGTLDNQDVSGMVCRTSALGSDNGKMLCR
jgi:hypothetical protein